MGILGLLGIRKFNNLRTINGAVGTDPDQAHQKIAVQAKSANWADVSDVARRRLGGGARTGEASAGASPKSLTTAPVEPKPPASTPDAGATKVEPHITYGGNQTSG